MKGEPKRAALAGTVAGFIVGTICVFLPHCLFWGEGQLNNVINRGAIPLPWISSSDLVAWAYCNPTEEGKVFGTACSGAIAVAKLVTTGLCLGTGIMGGHFWGPLFVGAAATWFIIGMSKSFGIEFLSTYPCIGLLCIMGSTHVVTYRTGIAIMLILTLTIDSFSKSANNEQGDYSAVLPLLVVAVFISLQISKAKENTIFYKEQCSRMDLILVPEVMVEPGRTGSAFFPIYEPSPTYEQPKDTEDAYSTYTSEHNFSDRDYDDDSTYESHGELKRGDSYSVISDVAPDIAPDIAPKRFAQKWLDDGSDEKPAPALPPSNLHKQKSRYTGTINSSNISSSTAQDKSPDSATIRDPSPTPRIRRGLQRLNSEELNTSSSRGATPPRSHRPSRSLNSAELNKIIKSTSPEGDGGRVSFSGKQSINGPLRSRNNSSDGGLLAPRPLERVDSYGKIVEPQLPLMEQARKSSNTRPPTQPRPDSARHQRQSSWGSATSYRDLFQTNSSENISPAARNEPQPQQKPAISRMRSDTT